MDSRVGFLLVGGGTIIQNTNSRINELDFRTSSEYGIIDMQTVLSQSHNSNKPDLVIGVI